MRTSGPRPTPLASRATRVPGWSARTTGRVGATRPPEERRPRARWPPARGSRRDGSWRRRSRPGAEPRRRPPGAPSSAAASRTISGTIRAARSCIRSPTRSTPSVIPSARQVRHRRRRRREAPAREVVRDDPVDLLGHRPVEAAQAGLDVGDRESRASPRPARRRASSSCRRTTSTTSGRSARQDRLERGEHPRRLLGAAAAADAERVVRPRQAQLGEERAGHRLVVVLAGVDEHLFVSGAEGRLQRRRLDQLRPRPDDARDAHLSAGRRRALTRRRPRVARRRLDADAVVVHARPAASSAAQRIAAVEQRARGPGTARSRGPEQRIAGLGDDRAGIGRVAPASTAWRSSARSPRRQKRVVGRHDRAVDGEPLDQWQRPRVRQLVHAIAIGQPQDEHRHAFEPPERLLDRRGSPRPPGRR